MLVSYGIINVTFAGNYQNQKLDQLAINILDRVNRAFWQEGQELNLVGFICQVLL